MFKTLLASLGLSVITSWHALLNRFGKSTKRKGVLYATYDGNKVLEPVQEKLPGTLLLTPSIYRKSSFLRRQSGEVMRFANIITKPFLGVYMDEKRFRARLARFLEESYRTWLGRNDFDKVVMIDEYSMPHTALTKAAKGTEMATIGVQHGVMFTDDRHYRADEGYKEYKRRKDASRVVDWFIAYSDVEKSYLMKDSPHLKAVALGCPRYDHLAKRMSAKEKEKIVRRLGVDPKKRTVVWATQTHNLDLYGKTENRANAEALFTYFAKHRDKYNFIIKLHPNEDQNAPLYHEYNDRFGNVAIILGKEHNTEELVRACDALIIKHSTVGAEAVLLGKPIIMLELRKSADLSIYTDEGFDNVIRKKDDVGKVLEHAFSKEGQESFKKKREAYIKRRFKNFGNATERVARFIIQTSFKK
ncbi:CDP-glycerol glycerophosphotransferase family protein [Candidatus Woesearchaeota archaeon]|nr:CDP-glycerol glycerophosphotransferase family protein [Candidatus Woesearchaeota archaeon]